MTKLGFYSSSVAVLLLGMCQAGLAQNTINCGDLANAYGPYDYTNADDRLDKLPRVEAFHFDLGVEQLSGHAEKGNSEAMVAGDLDYTLRAFPNHHRALFSMIRYYVEKVPKGAKKMRYSADCYLDRARRFASADAAVVMLEGIYFYKTGRQLDAIRSYEKAAQLAPNSAEVHYNAGLMYAKSKDYEKAMEHAARAYELGYPLQGLRNQLTRLGHWSESKDSAK